MAEIMSDNYVRINNKYLTIGSEEFVKDGYQLILDYYIKSNVVKFKNTSKVVFEEVLDMIGAKTPKVIAELDLAIHKLPYKFTDRTGKEIEFTFSKNGYVFVNEIEEKFESGYTSIDCEEFELALQVAKDNKKDVSKFMALYFFINRITNVNVDKEGNITWGYCSIREIIKLGIFSKKNTIIDIIKLLDKHDIIWLFNDMKDKEGNMTNCFCNPLNKFKACFTNGGKDIEESDYVYYDKEEWLKDIIPYYESKGYSTGKILLKNVEKDKEKIEIVDNIKSPKNTHNKPIEEQKVDNGTIVLKNSNKPNVVDWKRYLKNA